MMEVYSFFILHNWKTHFVAAKSLFTVLFERILFSSILADSEPSVVD